MVSLNSTINTKIIYSMQTCYTNDFNAQTPMYKIRECIQNSFNQLPDSYSVRVYNPLEAEVMDLEQHQLDFGYNPFKWSSPTGHENNDVILYVHKNRWLEFENNVATSDMYQNRTPTIVNDQLVTLPKERQCQQASSLHCRDRDTTSDLNGEFEESPINSQNDILSAALATDSVLDTDQSHETQPTLDALPDSSDTWQALLDTFKTQEQSFQLEHSPRIVSTGESMPPVNNPSNSFENSNGQQLSVGLNETQNMEMDRFKFSLDVKSQQKPIYRSDQYNQKIQNRKNGYITHVQGIKPKSARNRVLPKIHIPIKYRNKPNLFIDIYAIREFVQSGNRFGFKDRNKGFLQGGHTRNTAPVNPISFRVNEMKRTKDGDFELQLPMTTLWDKSKSSNGSVYGISVYGMTEQEVVKLHQAPFESSAPRLYGVLRQGDTILEDGRCLSDYIRPIG